MFEEITLFIAIVNYKNLTKVANELGLSKSQVSRRLTQIEQTLGHSLINRSTRKLSLTEAGERFYSSCLEMESSWHSTLEALNDEQTTLAGVLKITLPPSWANAIFMPIFAEFAKQYPEITFNLDLTSEIRDLYSGNYDLAIRLAPILPDSNLKARKLINYQSIICASPAYLKRHPAPKTPNDLKQHRCINSFSHSINRKASLWKLNKANKTQKIATQGQFTVSDYLAQRALALADYGVVLVPKLFVEQDIEQKQLVPLLKSYTLPEGHLWAIHPYQHRMPNRVRVLIDFIIDALHNNTI